jgi:hypothetical protein
MSRENPDYHDADLLLRVYDMRREAVLRQAREALNRDFWPASYEEVKAVQQREHPLNAAYRQVATYWEMVYGLVRHGVVHPDFFLETNGEGLLLFAKLEAHLARLRADGSPTTLANSEWVARETEAGRRVFARFSARVAQVVQSRKG